MNNLPTIQSSFSVTSYLFTVRGTKIKKHVKRNDFCLILLLEQVNNHHFE